MSKQVTNHIMMIRPVGFRLNEQTAVNNYYQKESIADNNDPQKKALKEFDGFVQVLRKEGVEVTVFDDTLDPPTPDSIFPNNWISFHEEGKIRLYPMFAENRRQERRDDIVEYFRKNYQLSSVVSYIDWEKKGAFLEGTGSLILDRENKIAYAAISQRTDAEVLRSFSKESGFKIVSFHAYQTVRKERLPIYHTNVLMCLGEQFAVLCLDAIDDEKEKLTLLASLEKTEKEIIEISETQKEHFAGNMLQLIGKHNQRLVVMSSQAFNSLHQDQVKQLERHGKIIHSDIQMIERLGGGSARCMMAEVFNRSNAQSFKTLRY